MWLWYPLAVTCANTHTHWSSNSGGGVSGRGVLGVRFNSRAVETVGDAAGRMPFDVPPSSFGGGESAERDECRWHRCGAGWVPSPFHPMRMWWVSLHPSIITIAAAAAATGYTAREARHYTRQERKAEEGRAGSVVEGVRYRSTRRNGSTGYGTRRWYPTTLGQPRVRWYPTTTTTTPTCLTRAMITTKNPLEPIRHLLSLPK
mmetsp:Transcript_17314/g.19948  ORF Transcript_17314/g.19948 Transcript_17314/m.19948 type:complete len:203 (-) Transcript_17314:223-831(-)